MPSHRRRCPPVAPSHQNGPMAAADVNGPDDPRGFAGRMVNRVVGTFVTPVVDTIDVENVVARVDVNELIGRVDVNALLDRVDADALLDRIDPNRLLERVDPEVLLARVDPNALLARMDPNALLARVDANALLDRVDPDALLDRVDANRLLDRLEPDRLLARIDLDALVGKVDVDAIVQRVDVDALMERVDVNRIVERTELGAVIARSTSGAFTQVLDVGRVRIVAADAVVHRVVGTLLARPLRGRPGRPGHVDDVVDLSGLPPRRRARAVQGHFAGAVSRFLAFLLDQFLVSISFAVIAAVVVAAIEVVVGRDLRGLDARGLVAGGFLLWWVLYYASQLAVSGRTVGKAVLGLLVVQADGAPLHGRNALARTVTFPLSFVAFGAGFLLGLVRGDRRQFHDLVGGSAVVYAWDARTAELRAAAVDDPLIPGTPS